VGATEMIIVFGLKDSKTILEAFYYGITPATAKASIDEDFEVDWDEVAMTLLTEVSDVFSGTLSEASTYSAKSDMLIMDLKAWSATDSVTNRYEVKVLGDTYVKRVTNA
jgi:hypothetical protein